jgi:hypothetical protein
VFPTFSTCFLSREIPAKRTNNLFRVEGIKRGKESMHVVRDIVKSATAVLCDFERNEGHDCVGNSLTHLAGVLLGRCSSPVAILVSALEHRFMLLSPMITETAPREVANGNTELRDVYCPQACGLLALCSSSALIKVDWVCIELQSEKFDKIRAPYGRCIWYPGRLAWVLKY